MYIQSLFILNLYIKGYEGLFDFIIKGCGRLFHFRIKGEIIFYSNIAIVLKFVGEQKFALADIEDKFLK